MAKGLKKDYCKSTSEEFIHLLENIKTNPDTLHFFTNTDTPYFFLADSSSAGILLQLHQDIWEFDSVFKTFTGFGQKQLIQSFLISEIQSTNSIENIQSTRHDIFHLIQTKVKGKNRKITSIANAYSILLNDSDGVPAELKDIRSIYDSLMKDALEKEDRPDGRYFRKKQVFISDGIKNIHRGFFPEEAVNNGMQEFLDLLNRNDTDLFERLILSHFLLETVHPYYDGNGRLGRFLFTQKYLNETGSYLSLAVSAAFNHQKSAYYKALAEARKEHMYGSLNAYFSDIGSILHTYQKSLINELKDKKEKIDSTVFSPEEFTKSERVILRLLAESSLLSDFGVSNTEIIQYASVSKRTVISSMQKFREMNLLEETKIGKTVYHKLKA